jgi:hypothetical protein
MNQHTDNSSYREKLIEHLFVGELLRLSWLHHGCSLEIAKPEVDNAGYDLVMESHGQLRHVQLKTSIIGGTASSQKVHLSLTKKPSGCVVWVYFNQESLELGPFLFFGGNPGQQMSDLGDLKTAKHTKGNKDGFKAERPNLRVVPKGQFKQLDSIEALYAQLFHGA